jgi:lipoprotein-anchoring transpeptidase ErfK/SrfK
VEKAQRPEQQATPDKQTEQAENDVRAILRYGLSAAHAGHYAQARRLFQAALDRDADNIVALLWLAGLASTRNESLTLLSRVLELDPKNEPARAGIRWARQLPLAHQDDSPATDPDSERSQWVRDLLESPKARQKARIGIVAQRARRFLGPFRLVLVVAACLFVAGAVLAARYSPSVVLAWMLPTASPAVTATVTPDRQPVSSPTPAVTATSTPTPTASPAPTATPTVAATVSLPSDPTWTPPPFTVPSTETPAPQAISAHTTDVEKWIDVDLTQQQLTAYEGSIPRLQVSVSTGLPRTPTVVGEFRIYWKLLATDMAGPNYYLPDVPYTMYFYRSYALHGTYWHDNFGHPMSHGCVNLRTEEAKWLFDWADPPLPSGAKQIHSSQANPGTRVVVHY